MHTTTRPLRLFPAAVIGVALSGCGLLGFDASSDDESTSPGAPTTPTTLPDGAPAPPPEPAPVGPIADAGTLSDARAPGIDVVRLEALTDVCNLEAEVELEVLCDWETSLGQCSPWHWGDYTIGGTQLVEERPISGSCLGTKALVWEHQNLAMWGGGMGISTYRPLAGSEFDGVAFLARAIDQEGSFRIELTDDQVSGAIDPLTGERYCTHANSDTDGDGAWDTGKDTDGDGVMDPVPTSERCTPWAVRAFFGKDWALHLLPWSAFRQDPQQGKLFDAPDGIVHLLHFTNMGEPSFELWFDSIAFYRRRAP